LPFGGLNIMAEPKNVTAIKEKPRYCNYYFATFQGQNSHTQTFAFFKIPFFY
jgi:hypothetical protein